MALSGERLFRRWFPHYRPRWEVYDDRLCSFLAPNVVWLDVGCGNNALVRLFHARAGVAAGVDRITIANAEGARFVQADLRRLQLLKNLRSNLLAVFQKQASPTELLHDR